METQRAVIVVYRDYNINLCDPGNDLPGFYCKKPGKNPGSGEAAECISMSTQELEVKLWPSVLWFLNFLKGGSVGKPLRGLEEEDRCVGEKECVRKPSGCVNVTISHVQHCGTVWTWPHGLMDF